MATITTEFAYMRVYIFRRYRLPLLHNYSDTIGIQLFRDDCKIMLEVGIAVGYIMKLSLGLLTSSTPSHSVYKIMILFVFR